MKRHLFYTFLWVFAATALLAVIGVLKIVAIEPEYLHPLFWSILVEASGAVILMFKRADFLNDPPPRDLLQFKPSHRARRVLATLWHFQRQHFGEDRTRLWALSAPPDRAQLPDFFRAVAEILEVGLVDLDRDTRMIALTTEGYRYCEAKNYGQYSEERYRF